MSKKKLIFQNLSIEEGKIHADIMLISITLVFRSLEEFLSLLRERINANFEIMKNTGKLFDGNMFFWKKNVFKLNFNFVSIFYCLFDILF